MRNINLALSWVCKKVTRCQCFYSHLQDIPVYYFTMSVLLFQLCGHKATVAYSKEYIRYSFLCVLVCNMT